MPDLSRFGGIVIRMYFEAGEPNHLPHFHAYCQDAAAVYAIDPVGLLAGSLSRREQRLVEAWAELRQTELIDNWNRLQSGLPTIPIPPLS